MKKNLFYRGKLSFIKITLLIVLVPGYLFSEETNSYILKGPLAGSIYYTENKPGKWSKFTNSHKPILEIKDNTLLVTTPHEMKGYDHYIIKHIVLDNKLKFISEKNFGSSIEMPISKHDISGYNGTLYVLSICNKHDTWLNVIEK